MTHFLSILHPNPNCKLPSRPPNLGEAITVCQYLRTNLSSLTLLSLQPHPLPAPQPWTQHLPPQLLLPPLPANPAQPPPPRPVFPRLQISTHWRVLRGICAEGVFRPLHRYRMMMRWTSMVLVLVLVLRLATALHERDKGWKVSWKREWRGLCRRVVE